MEINSRFIKNSACCCRPKSRPLVSQPVPIHTTHRPISATHAINASSKWEEATLRVPDTQDENKTPIPPPRKKRQQRLQQERWRAVPRPPPPQPPEAAKKKRRQKTLSTISLPNYSELTLSVYDEKPATGQNSPPRNESCVSLTGKNPGLSSLTVEKIEYCVKRCRSFGAFKPEQLKLQSAPRHSSESDDSFDGLDDWDLRVIEHDDAHESPPHTMLPPQGARRHLGSEWHSDENPSRCNVNKGEEVSVPVTPHKETANLPDGRIDRPQRTLKSVTPHEEKTASTSGHIIDQRKASLISVPEHEETMSSQDNRVDQPEHTPMSDTSHSEPATGCKVDGEEGPEHTSAEDQTQDENASQPDRTGCERDDTTVLVYDFLNPNKSFPDVGLVNGLNETGTPTGLKTPPPTPEHTKSKKQENPSHSDEYQATHSSLLRLLKDYQKTDGITEDSGAQQVLKDLGVPPTLRESTSRGSSRRSSMTPSLSELEAALSDLLEASASRTGAEDDEEDVTPPVQQTMRVISPKPFSAFSSTFHPVQRSVRSKQLETSA